VMDKIIKYVRVIDRWVIGVVLELIYPLITFTAAALVCYLMYLTTFIKK